MSDKKYAAILMGDIVDSRSKDVALLHKEFNKAVIKANHRFLGHISSPLTITLGDEFQGLVKTPSVAFEVALYIRRELLKNDISCRFVIGYSQLETKINRKNSWNMIGTGLTNARAELENKNDKNLYKFILTAEHEELQILLNGVGLSLSRIESTWTERQKDLVLKLIENKNKSIADFSASIKVSKNTTYKVLRAADYDLYQALVSGITKSLTIFETRKKHV